MGVKINGIDLETTYGFYVETVEGLEMPRVRQNVQVIPGIHGELDFGGTFETRQIYLVGHIYATNHANSVSALQSFMQSTTITPLGSEMAALTGFPLSPTSGNGILELPDFTDRHFLVIYNGTFEAEWVGKRRVNVAKAIRIRIGFKQTQPWALSNTPNNAVGATDNSAYMNADNGGGLHVPPKISFGGINDVVDSFSMYNMGVDPFATKSITGTIGGTPVFRETNYGSFLVDGAVDFQAGTDFITYPLGSNILTQESGTIELLYLPNFAAGANDTVLWTLYVSATELWRCWYDSAANRFKFQMRSNGSDVTVNSGVGITAANQPHHIVCSWQDDSAYIAVNGSTRVSGVEVRITYPATIRIGSSGANTLPAKGIIEEFIIWNHDVGQSYITGVWNNSRYKRPFGRPIPGVLLYADYNFSPHAVGCGDKVFTYSKVGFAVGVGDVVFADMEKQTVVWWDVSTATKFNAIEAMGNHFFDLMPGMNTFYIVQSGSGDLTVNVNFIKRYLI